MNRLLEHSRAGLHQIRFIQRMLAKIDRLNLPVFSRHDVEVILCRQVARFIEVNLPRHTGHGERTACVALTLGKAVGLSRSDLHHLKLAALLHDIGLLTLPTHIVSSQNPLEMDDYALFQDHSRRGAQLLEPYRFLQTAACWIAHHHERWDGYGYPYGLRGDFIPLGARILAVADTFDALCSRPSSGDAFSREVALELLCVGAGSQLDPQLVEVFATVGRTRRPDFYSVTPRGWLGEI
jgi:HD-GYP domain-containing protein (c-di-GMP phosphodiesterase class II)